MLCDVDDAQQTKHPLNSFAGAKETRKLIQGDISK